MKGSPIRSARLHCSRPWQKASSGVRGGATLDDLAWLAALPGAWARGGGESRTFAGGEAFWAGLELNLGTPTLGRGVQASAPRRSRREVRGGAVMCQGRMRAQKCSLVNAEGSDSGQLEGRVEASYSASSVSTQPSSSVSVRQIGSASRRSSRLPDPSVGETAR